MKIYITRLYGFDGQEELAERQQQLAQAGHALGFYEMGIFADFDEQRQLAHITAALEPEDVVLLQFPTTYGAAYERQILQAVKDCRTKLVLLFHLEAYEADTGALREEYRSFWNMADAVLELPYMQESSLQAFLLQAVCEAYAADQKAFSMRMPAAEDEIQIGFGLYDKTGTYSVFVGTVMQSMIEHTCAPICFHILHDETLTETNREKLLETAAAGGQRICFHALSQADFSDVEGLMGRFTIGTMFRVLLPELLSDVKKLIYLDADLFVNRDIKELWDTDISTCALAAVCDEGINFAGNIPVPVQKNEIRAEHYFNTGVLLMNLERIRKMGNMKEQVFQYLAGEPGATLPDQDALNMIYGNETLLLDADWNCFMLHVQKRKEEKLRPCIYHFAGTCNILYASAADRAYYETMQRTPWGTDACQRQLDLCFGRTNDRMLLRKKLLTQLCVYEKKRVFYGRETSAMRHLYELLPPRACDYRVLENPAKETNCLLECQPLSVLREETASVLVFVLPEADGGNAMKHLEQMGLKNETDFFVIPRLLPPEQGGYA